MTLSTLESPVDELLSPLHGEVSPARVVALADGTRLDLSTLTPAELLRLQFDQEQAFAGRFVEFPKRTAERAAAFAQGYDTVTAIYAAANGMTGPVVMGLDRRYEALVLGLLREQQLAGVMPRLFEVGYGSGVLLERISRQGFAVGGIEVSPAMYAQACDALPSQRDNLLLGDFMSLEWADSNLRDRSSKQQKVLEKSGYTLVYWNDVFEHIPRDEIADYLARIYDLVAPGGILVTITPNWHIRPNDVTGDFCPPRTEARGVHLKEYSLREVTSLLRAAGFATVATPLFVTPNRIYRCGGGLASVKRLFEPVLELLPFTLAKFLVRGFGMSCTIARRE
jgi:SAM-dependent methyltransferase